MSGTVCVDLTCFRDGLIAMKFEHFALNVETPLEIVDWYVANCGLKIARGSREAPYAHFLADATGLTMLEVYHNPAAPVLEFKDLHHLQFHFAFAVDDAESVKQRLIAAGATLTEELRPADGSHLVMLRDPFGLSLQLCQRAAPFPDPRDDR